MNQENNQSWDLIIEGKSSLFDFSLRDVWRYRDLLWILVKRDFVSFYKQTVLGPLWFFIQPIFTTLVFTFIFGNLAGISTGKIPQPLFFLAGITAWNYFADCLLKTSTVFKDNANIFGKVYFPRIIMPISIVVSNLVRCGVQFLLLIGVYAYYLLQDQLPLPSIKILLFPVLVILMAMLGLGLGLIITALTTKYRDLAFLVQFGVQLLMYATTVAYPLTAAPEKYRSIIELNPMTGIIEFFRFSLLGDGSVSLNQFLYSACASLILLFIGVIIFNRTEKSFVDTI